MKSGVPIENRTALLLNAFQTDSEVASRLMEELRRTLPDGAWEEWLFIEPAAGDGAFYDLLPRDRRIGVDVDAKLCASRPEYLAADFLALSRDDIARRFPQRMSVPRERTVIVGNPPFSVPRSASASARRRNVALEFLNHAASMADTVAFILGRHFRRVGLSRRIDRGLSLLHECMVPDKAFAILGERRSVNTVFQIWRRGAPATPLPLAPRCVLGDWGGDWRFVLPSDPDTNLLVRRWGSASTIGEVVVDGAVIAKRIAASAAKEAGLNRRVGRNSAPYFHLHAADPVAAGARFLYRREAFRTLVTDSFIGNNPSVTQEEVILIYRGEVGSLVGPLRPQVEALRRPSS